MRTPDLNLDFRRLNEVNVTELFDTLGVYVLWDGRSRSVPSYIGEGDLLKRVYDHSKVYAKPLSGYIGRLGDQSRRYFKTDAETVEAVLLHIADRIGRTPLHNRQSGSLTAVGRSFGEDQRIVN